MRIGLLTIARYPKTIARVGGDVRLWQSLASLVALGHEVHVIAIDPEGELEPAIEKLAASVTTLRTRIPPRTSPRWLPWRIFNHETLLLRFPDLFGHRTMVTRALDKLAPDLVWAEEQLTAVLVPERMPLVISHVDFFFRLMKVRDTYRRLRRPNTMTNSQLERLEYALCRRARVTLVASETDAERFRERGVVAAYIPVVGPTLPPPDPRKLSPGRFFLFGKANTAMRAARQHFRTVVWPLLDDELQRDWHQVGDPPRDPSVDPSWRWLTERFEVHGFVDDLSQLFMFGDASVMPYPIDASGHAKYSVGMGYGMVNIGYVQGYVSTPELVPGENCLAAATAPELVALLREYRADAALRRRLAEASRATYETKFSFEAQLANFEKLLGSVAARASASS